MPEKQSQNPFVHVQAIALRFSEKAKGLRNEQLAVRSTLHSLQRVYADCFPDRLMPELLQLLAELARLVGSAHKSRSDGTTTRMQTRSMSSRQTSADTPRHYGVEVQEAIRLQQQAGAALPLLHVLAYVPIPTAALNTFLAGMLEAGETLDPWSTTAFDPDRPAGSSAKQRKSKHREPEDSLCSKTPLTVAMEEYNDQMVTQLVKWGASIGIPIWTPAPSSGPYTSPLHAAACMHTARPDMLALLEAQAEPEDLVTLDSDGNFYTDLLESEAQQEDDSDLGSPLPYQQLLCQLQEGVICQDAAMRQIAQLLRQYQAGLQSQNRPLVLMLMGCSGTGKTEAAKQIAQVLNGRSIDVRLGMQEFSAEISVSRLTGSAPGYTGDPNGVLFGISKLKHQAVVLIDEAEKAHPNVLKFFLSIFDEGYFTTSSNIKVVCNKAVFIMTSNSGRQVVSEHADEIREASPESQFHAEFYKQHLHPELLKTGFALELLARVTLCLPFPPFLPEQICAVAEHVSLKELRSLPRLNTEKLAIVLSRRMVRRLASAYVPDFGAREFLISDQLKGVKDSLGRAIRKSVLQSTGTCFLIDFWHDKEVVLNLLEHRHQAVRQRAACIVSSTVWKMDDADEQRAADGALAERALAALVAQLKAHRQLATAALGVLLFYMVCMFASTIAIHDV